MRISELKDFVDQQVEITGWVIGKRSSGKIHFILIRDSSAFCQVVVAEKEVHPEVFEQCKHLNIETVIKIKALAVEEPRAKLGYELHLKDMEVLSTPVDEYPIPRKPSGPDFLLNYRHLWIRSPRQSAIMRIRSKVISAIRNYLDQQGFYCVDTPIFTASSCEGTTTLFKVDYFNQDVFLAQTGQLYNEATALCLDKVYCFGPSFRAEKSKTRRHLTEFWQVEPEFLFARLEDIINLAEGMIVRIVEEILTHHQIDLKILDRDISKLEQVKAPFPRMTYDQALQLLQEKNISAEWGKDFGAPEETKISESFNSPVCIHRYPSAIKAFYMKQAPEDNRLALGVDILAPEGYGEIVGGGVREEDIAILEQRIDQHQLNRDDYQWYLDLRRYGSVPHGGFGLGIERTVAWICGIHHIRETIAFPRTIDRIKP